MKENKDLEKIIQKTKFVREQNNCKKCNIKKIGNTTIRECVFDGCKNKYLW